MMSVLFPELLEVLYKGPLPDHLYELTKEPCLETVCHCMILAY